MSLATLARKLTPTRSSTATGAIGLEFALDAMHAVQLSSADDGFTLHAAASLAYPGTRQQAMSDGPLLATLLRKLIRSGNFTGRRVVAALPAPEMSILPIQYTAAKDGSDSKAILELAADRLPEPLTEYVLDYIPVRNESRDGQRMALVAVSRRAVVLELLKNLRKANLDPHAIEIGPVALRRLVASVSSRDKVQNILVINVGERKSFLTMISGRRLLMDQEVAVGQEQLLQSVAAELALSPETALATINRCGLTVDADGDEESRDEAQTMRLILTAGFRRIADELEQAFAYAASVTRGAPERTIYLSGSVSRWPGATQFLSEISGIEVTCFPSPFAGFNDVSETSSEPVEFAIATGLALRGLFDDG